ncbi:hypothetical protein [Parvularcula sp. LCG005]|uniref:hypothetical protein n=1 Tax=Parvularcula sp. LCG005 TaxID=3078805 RepID=UPI002942A0D5|nr:hypothetical protein [Parvularcula sp. LCG005]WOI54216.1 hypothetical protein RUI03_04265 [Parvularcula sp. LCG005]
MGMIRIWLWSGLLLAGLSACTTVPESQIWAYDSCDQRAAACLASCDYASDAQQNACYSQCERTADICFVSVTRDGQSRYGTVLPPGFVFFGRVGYWTELDGLVIGYHGQPLTIYQYRYPSRPNYTYDDPYDCYGIRQAPRCYDRYDRDRDRRNGGRNRDRDRDDRDRDRDRPKPKPPVFKPSDPGPTNPPPRPIRPQKPTTPDSPVIRPGGGRGKPIPVQPPAAPKPTPAKPQPRPAPKPAPVKPQPRPEPKPAPAKPLPVPKKPTPARPTEPPLDDRDRGEEASVEAQDVLNSGD